jgi:hypothetical protein
VQALTNFLQKKKTNLKKDLQIFPKMFGQDLCFDKGDSKYAEHYGKQLMLRTK